MTSLIVLTIAASITCATGTTLVHGGTPPTCSQLAYADVLTAAIATAGEYYAGTASKLVPAAVIYPVASSRVCLTASNSGCRAARSHHGSDRIQEVFGKPFSTTGAWLGVCDIRPVGPELAKFVGLDARSFFSAAGSVEEPPD